jgi:hypothetical protein
MCFGEQKSTAVLNSKQLLHLDSTVFKTKRLYSIRDHHTSSTRLTSGTLLLQLSIAAKTQTDRRRNFEGAEVVWDVLLDGPRAVEEGDALTIVSLLPEPLPVWSIPVRRMSSLQSRALASLDHSHLKIERYTR